MADYSDWYSLVRVSTGAPDLLLLQSIQRAARYFCNETHAYVDTLGLSTMSNEKNPVLELPAGTALKTVEYIQRRGTYEFLAPVENASFMASDRTGRPAKYTVLNGAELQLFPIPDGVYLYDVRVILTPTLQATALDDVVASQYEEGIVARAIYELLRMPGKPWTDPRLAETYRIQARIAIVDARNRTLLTRSNVTPTVFQ